MNTIDTPRKAKSPVAFGLFLLAMLSGVVGLAAYYGPWNERTRQQGSSLISPAEGSPVVTVAIPVEGMTCASCVASIKSAVEKIEGVTSAEVDLAERRARVTYRPGKTSPEEISASIRKLGYEPGTPTTESGQ